MNLPSLPGIRRVASGGVYLCGFRSVPAGMSLFICHLISMLALASGGVFGAVDPVRVSLVPEGSSVRLGRSALVRGYCLLPEGFLPGSGAEAALCGRSGARYPTVVHCTATYPGGSARALRITAELPVKLLRAAATLDLVPGAAPDSSKPLRVTREAGRVQVDTGALWLTLAGEGPDLLPELRVRAAKLRDPARPARIELEVNGVHYSSQFDAGRRVGVAGEDALSCRLRVAGHLARSDGLPGLEYHLGLDFLAGSPLVEIDVHFRGLADLGVASDLRLELPLASGSATRAQLLGTGANVSLKGGGLRIEALDGQSVEAVGPRGRTSLPAGQRNGLLFSGSGSASVALAVSRLRPQAPRAVVAGAGGNLTVLFHAGPFLLDETFALRSDLVLGAFPRQEARRFSPALLQEPVPALRGDQHFVEALPGFSRLAPGWAGPDDEVHPRLLDLVERGLLTEVGYRDYGDYRYLEGFANLEYDPALAFLLAGLEGSDPSRLILARDQLNHWAAFDRSRGERGVPLGFPWMHGPDHRSLLHETGHVWAGGAVLGWLILGDPELGTAVHELERALIQLAGDPAEFREERTFGWTLLALEDLLLLRPDPDLEQSARRLARELMQSQDERGYFRLDPAPERTGADFAPTPWVTAGITVEALYRQHLRTGEADLLECIGRATDFLVRDARGEDGTFAKQVFYGGELASRLSRAGRANAIDRLLIAAGLGRATLLRVRPGVQTVFQETLLKACSDLKSHRMNAHQAAKALIGVRSLANTRAVSGASGASGD